MMTLSPPSAAASAANAFSKGLSTTKAQRTGKVIDLALRTFEDNEDISSLFDSSSFVPPPLDQVTICSEDASESSDLSSVSSDDDLRSSSSSSTRSSTASPRPIFGDYWTKKGGAPAALRRVKSLEDEDELGDDIIKRSLSSSSASHKDPCSSSSDPNDLEVLSPTTRRSIFSHSLCASSPALSLVDVLRSNGRPELRKTQSTSALRKKKSCLRSGRFSPSGDKNLGEDQQQQEPSSNGPRRRSDSDLSVTFSPQVNVLVFDRPVEQFASKGWSTYFAS